MLNELVQGNDKEDIGKVIYVAFIYLNYTLTMCGYVYYWWYNNVKQ